MTDEERAATVDAEGAFRRWSGLMEHGSVAGTRRIDWPVASHIANRPVLQGARRQWDQGWTTLRHSTPFPLRPPIDWSANPNRSKEWRNRLMWMTPVDPYALAWRNSKDPIWLQRAADLLVDWAAFHRDGTKDSFRAWADMNVGFRAVKYAWAIDHALRGQWHPDDDAISNLVWAMDSHLERLQREDELSEGNHGIFQLFGLQILGSVAWNSPYAADAHGYVDRHLKRLLGKQFLEDGTHKEHSTNYHWFMTQHLRALAETGWYSPASTEWTMAVTDRAEEIKHWLTAPSGIPVATGDSREKRPPPAPILSEAPDVAGDLYRFRWLPDGGYAACKTRYSLLLLAAAYHSKSHKHSDDLHVELHDLSRSILIDGGSQHDDPGPMRSYQVGTASHNTVQCDDEDWAFRGEDTYGSGLVSATCFEGGLRLRAAVDHVAQKVQHLRQLDYQPGARLICRDALLGQRPHVFRQWFHFDPSWRVDARGEGWLSLTDGQIFVRLQTRGAERMDVFHGQMEPEIQGWRYKDGRMMASTSVAVVATGARVRFETMLRLDDDPEEGWGEVIGQFVRDPARDADFATAFLR